MGSAILGSGRLCAGAAKDLMPVAPDQLFVGPQFGNDVLLHIGGRHRHQRIASDRPPLCDPSVMLVQDQPRC